MMGRKMVSLTKAAFFGAFFLVLAAGLGFLTGCSSRSGGADAPAFGELRQVHDLLHRAAGSLKRRPARVEDLNRFQGSYPLGYEVVRSGKILVRWETELKGEGEVGKNEGVLAYEKDVPTQGGYVLLSAGTIKKMSSSEFQSAVNRK